MAHQPLTYWDATTAQERLCPIGCCAILGFHVARGTRSGVFPNEQLVKFLSEETSNSDTHYSQLCPHLPTS